MQPDKHVAGEITKRLNEFCLSINGNEIPNGSTSFRCDRVQKSVSGRKKRSERGEFFPAVFVKSLGFVETLNGDHGGIP